MGKWVSEIRMSKLQEKIWLGSYKTAEQAVRAYDAAVYCLRGAADKLNFLDSVPNIPASASSLFRQQIQRVATKYVLGKIPSSSSPLHNNTYNSEAREKHASPSTSSWISETDLSSSSQHISKELDWELWESLFDGKDSLNFEKLSLYGESSTSEFIPTWQKQKNQG